MIRGRSQAELTIGYLGAILCTLVALWNLFPALFWNYTDEKDTEPYLEKPFPTEPRLPLVFAGQEVFVRPTKNALFFSRVFWIRLRTRLLSRFKKLWYPRDYSVARRFEEIISRLKTKKKLDFVAVAGYNGKLRFLTKSQKSGKYI